jgi:hypothetical protein
MDHGRENGMHAGNAADAGAALSHGEPSAGADAGMTPRSAQAAASVQSGDATPAALASALRMERLLALRYRKALECACDAPQAELWRSGLAEALLRATALARRLEGAAASALFDESAEAGDCLVEAMDLALSNGDRVAAQAVARECMLLAEAQCAQVRAALPMPSGRSTVARPGMGRGSAASRAGFDDPMPAT